MLITGRHSLSTLLRYLADSLIVLNILALILLPLILTALYQNPTLILQLDPPAASSTPDIRLASEYPSDLPPDSYPFYLGFLYAAGIGTAMVLIQGHRILRRLERNEPFTAGQAGSFHLMAWAFFWLALTFLVKVFAYNTLLTMFCCLLFFAFGVVCLILADVFHQAWLVKSENELTI